ncbi:hypothetical protein [Wolbachia endosymbiont of Ctenocephalides felis wCfeJ]|uniref:hypothetical protein n=1 Tax=Wolbachia endosymbiont of Ctenocephalides felis wCfeJ TaxID=2732594 RepID=UPI001448083F|nr:hypothetical protein [Wolbachia endosymbiont of Ctenocephalides felis wCfeJ]WCR58455.1 MAG: hypothetical protein PG980_000927 [Wolbachia endosymbiont of Ctenocephalides felis wCfeJ]
MTSLGYSDDIVEATGMDTCKLPADCNVRDHNARSLSPLRSYYIFPYFFMTKFCSQSLDIQQTSACNAIKCLNILLDTCNLVVLINLNYQTDVPTLKLILSNVKALKKEDSGLKSSVATFIDISKEYAKKEEQLTEEPIYVTMNPSSKPLEMNLDNRIVEAVIKAQQWEQLHISLESLGPQMVGQM